MKLILLFILAFPFFGNTQITLTETDFSDGGDNTWISTVTDNGIDFSTTGQSMTWDFSGMVSTGQSQKQYFTLSNSSQFVQLLFGIFASSQYQATNFVNSDALPLNQIPSGILPVTISDVRQFSKNSTNSITSIGLTISIDGNEVPFKSDTIETRYEFPMNYGDAYSSRGYTEIDMNPVTNAIWRQYRQRSSTVDGWGSITTPYGTFDALRIDHFIQETDSILIEIFGNPTWIPLAIPDSHQYEWITNGEKEPILRITTSILGGNETVTKIEYKDNEIVGLKELENQFNAFPNPTNSTLTIDGIQQKTTYSIFTMDGKEVVSGELSAMNNQIDVHSFTEGSYQIVLSQEGRSIILPFLKK